MLNRDLLYKAVENFNIEIDARAYERLDIFAEMLVETNRSFNLTAITQPDEVTVKHFADCLSLFGFADIPKNSKIIDVGTGAGFPGLVLKLARPDIDMTFLDGTGKKLGFISGVLEAAGEKGTILHKRAEEAARLPEYRERYDFATARAVAAMPALCEYCLPFVKKGGSFIAMKSAQGDEELALAVGAVSLLGGRTDKVFDFELTGGLPRKIIIIKKISQTPTKYPRASAQISKKPLK